MLKIAFFVSSRFGQTAKIAHFIENQLQEMGHTIQSDFFNLEHLEKIDFNFYQFVIIGASIRYGQFHHNLIKFSNRYAEELNALPTAFFGVNLTARKSNKNQPENNSYIRKFLQKTAWYPSHVAVFAGALEYSKYGFFDKKIIQLIMKITGGETDSSKDFEYTDWQSVIQFTQKIIEK